MSSSDARTLKHLATSPATNNHPSEKANAAPTHFLALPLVTPHSLPQLSRSISRFQAATTAARALRPSELALLERARERGAAGKGEEEELTEQGGESVLKIIPEKAQRAVGTLHLTLGTMVLNTPEEYKKALEVLRNVDYEALLGRVGKKTPSQNKARKADAAATDKVLGGERGDGDASSALMNAGEEVAASLSTLARPVSPPVLSIRGAKLESEGQRGTKGINIDLRGLGTFPSAKKARVFYAVPHDEEDRLQAFAEAVEQRFLEQGVLRKEGRPLTLHATVANLKYAKTGKWGGGRGGRGGKGRKGGMGEIDATELVNALGKGGSLGHGDGGGFVWAEGIVIDRVRICKMGAVKSEDPDMGMEYPAIRVPVEGDEGEGKLAEVVF